MVKCRKCGQSIRFEKRSKKYWPMNLDGVGHWETCQSDKHWTEYREVSSGIIHGDRCKPNECDCGLPPWELCKPDCQWALNPAEPMAMLEFDAVQHLREI